MLPLYQRSLVFPTIPVILSKLTDFDFTLSKSGVAEEKHCKRQIFSNISRYD